MPPTPEPYRPTLEYERIAWGAGRDVVVGIDEVGRGSLAGPVGVGAVALTPDCSAPPARLQDSKKLTAATRSKLIPQIHQWVGTHAVGYASAAEVDQHGLTGALQTAALRALADLAWVPDQILLDGRDNWLAGQVPCPVQMLVKGDQRSVTIAAASVLAKVARDAVMVQLAEDFPEYGWAKNKGYAAAAHIAALTEHGVTPHHRVSWRLPGISDHHQEELPI